MSPLFPDRFMYSRQKLVPSTATHWLGHLFPVTGPLRMSLVSFQNWRNLATFLIGLSWGLNTIVYLKCLVRRLTQSKGPRAATAVSADVTVIVFWYMPQYINATWASCVRMWSPVSVCQSLNPSSATARATVAKCLSLPNLQGCHEDYMSCI